MKRSGKPKKDKLTLAALRAANRPPKNITRRIKKARSNPR